MQIVDPCVPPDLVPIGSRPLIYGLRQSHYQALPSVVTPAGAVITRWRPTEAERAALVRGEDLYLTVLTFRQPLQPVSLSVGVADWRRL